MKKNWDTIDDIVEGIIGRLVDTNSSEQNDLLEKKLNDSQWKTDHAHLINKKYLLDELARRADQETQLEYDYRQFKQRVVRPNRDSRTRRTLKFWRAVAAVSVCMICLGGLYWMMHHNDGSAGSGTIASTNRIESPVIELADGNRIKLSDQKLASSQDKYGFRVEQGVVKFCGRQTQSTTPEIHKIVVPRGNTLQVMLPDSSSLWLNSDSWVSFPTRFSGDKREITVAGEVYLKVTHDESKQFIVHNADNEIRVYGTEFNIRNYADEGSFCVTLAEGKISYANNRHPEVNRLIEPGYALSYKTLDKISYARVDINEITGWRTGNICYKERTLKYILNDLSRLYDVTFKISDPVIERMKFDADFKRFDNIDIILDILTTSGDVEFVKDQGAFSVKLKAK